MNAVWNMAETIPLTMGTTLDKGTESPPLFLPSPPTLPFPSPSPPSFPSPGGSIAFQASSRW